MPNDFDSRYAAVSSRDSRFDGVFFTAVTSTRIYCRPSCPAMTPKPGNVRFYTTSAAAQAAGFRACRRCRPDAAPGSPEWNVRGDVVARAMRLIADGAIDRGGVDAVARRLGVTPRHLHRVLTVGVGAGPLALARVHRAETARLLIETTAMTFADVAFAAGFASVRQFNETIASVYDATPTALRNARTAKNAASPPASPAAIDVRLPYRVPCDIPSLLHFLGIRAVAGIEEFDGATYRRSLRLPHGHGIVELSDGGGYVACRLRLEHLADVGAAVARCRRLLDLDADPVAIDAHLGADPLLAPMVAAQPGRRVPGSTDSVEMAFRAVVGQQVTVAGARTVVGRVVERLGSPLRVTDATLTRVFPAAHTMADDGLGFLPMPTSRRDALVGVMRAVADGDIDLGAGCDLESACAALLAIRGIGPWTVAYIAMRALGDPDAFLAADLGVRRAFEAAGLPGDPVSATRRAEAWRPWRAYALQHLWSAIPSSAPPAVRKS